MKAYYLEDKIKEAHGQLRVKVLKLVYANAAEIVSKEVCDVQPDFSMPVNRKIDSRCFINYDIKQRISVVSLIAKAILIRELEETYKPYKEAGLDLDLNGYIEYTFREDLFNEASDEKLCKDFNEKIDEICQVIKNSKMEVDSL